MSRTPATRQRGQDKVLEDVLRLTRALARKGERPIWVLDIDDTLLSTTARHLRILREFAKKKGLKLSPLAEESVSYAIGDTARSAGLHEEAHLADLREFWFERFFRNDYLGEDRPVEGAPQFCSDLLSVGASIVYLTGRDETMRSGTISALKNHGFPLPDESSLLLKPEFSMSDREYKEKALERLSRTGKIAGGFENEPLHIHLLLELFPSGRMVLVDTRHSGRPAPPLDGVPKIKNFLPASR